MATSQQNTSWRSEELTYLIGVVCDARALEDGKGGTKKGDGRTEIDLEGMHNLTHPEPPNTLEALKVKVLLLSKNALKLQNMQSCHTVKYTAVYL